MIDGLLIDRLEYADDAALLDTVIAVASQRISKVERGFLQDAAMEVSRPKTKVMLVQEQEEVAAVTAEDFAAAAKKGVLPFRCIYCGEGFATKVTGAHLLSCGAAQRGVYEEGREYEVERVVSYRGKPDNRFYLVLWKPQANGLPWPKDNTTWEPARHLVGCDELVSQFWDSYQARHLNVNEDFPGCENENRCHWCCKFFKRPQDLKGHLTKGCDQKPKRQHNTKSKSGKAVKRMKQAEAQKHMEQVLIGETRLENVYDFPYLGHHFQADGDALHAVEVRLAMASNRFGQLHHIWSSNILSMRIKT